MCTSKEAYKQLASHKRNSIPSNNTRRPSLKQPILQLLKCAWTYKFLQPRFKTFAWKLQTSLSNKQVGNYSKHIDKHCTRCGLVENEDNIFFTCSFSRAIWFSATSPILADALNGEQVIQAQIVALLSR
jgi:hypothetical protein